MEEQPDPLTLELLTWIREHPATYSEIMEVWRTNCPRHSVWEDALSAGMIETKGKVVRLTAYGTSVLCRAAQTQK